MSAKSTDVYAAIRSRLLTFTPAVSDPLSADLGSRLYYSSPPENAEYPYALFRLVGRSTGNLDDSLLEEEGSIELTIVGRHRQQLSVIEGLMDVAEEALLKWHTDQVGWFTIRRLLSRTTLPEFRHPADVEIVQVRATWRYTWWPTYRSQYAAP